MEEIKINSEFIKLDAFLKWANIVSSGSDAKFFIRNGEVKVNDEIEVRRGKKLYIGDIIEFEDKKYKIID
ncbi:S4 domain-containing protein YaaA [Clostridium sediminicola]|uniref:S4 domain-containing protein YaaA n=1 Tax=Clostridium sediminicola TaxID=3114879 RepID=UPI0031F233EB